MHAEAGTSTYSVTEPFEVAVASVRRALVDGGLRVTMELNVSERIRRRLLIGISPCTIFFASSADPVQDSAGPLAPLHIVVSAHGAESEVHILRPRRGNGAALDQLQTQIAHAIERIGIRVRLGV